MWRRNHSAPIVAPFLPNSKGRRTMTDVSEPPQGNANVHFLTPAGGPRTGVSDVADFVVDYRSALVFYCMKKRRVLPPKIHRCASCTRHVCICKSERSSSWPIACSLPDGGAGFSNSAHQPFCRRECMTSGRRVLPSAFSKTASAPACLLSHSS